MTRQKWLKSGVLTALLGLPLQSPALEVHLQNLPPAPGLVPSQPLDPLEGVTNALNCGLDFLNTAKQCGLTAPSDAVAPYSVSFDPMLCRLTLRFSIGELIDGMLKSWLAGAFAQLNTPAVGALCLLGLGPQYCQGSTTLTSSTTPTPSLVIPPSTWLRRSYPSSPAHVSPQQQIQEAPRAATREAPAVPAAPPAAPAQSAPSPPPSSENRPHGATGLDNLVR